MGLDAAYSRTDAADTIAADTSAIRKRFWVLSCSAAACMVRRTPANGTQCNLQPSGTCQDPADRQPYFWTVLAHLIAIFAMLG